MNNRTPEIVDVNEEFAESYSCRACGQKINYQAIIIKRRKLTESLREVIVRYFYHPYCLK